MTGFEGRGLSAGERFRRRWSTYVRRSTAVAVGLHVGALLLSPSWRPSARLVELFDPGTGGLLLLAPLGELMPEPGGAPPEPVSPFGDPDGTATEAGGGIEGPVVTDAAGSLWDQMGERLRSGRTVIPSLAVPTTSREVRVPGADAAPEPIEPDDEDEPAPEIESDVTTIELANLPSADSLDLSRLTGLRPELAFMTASAWVLIRNQEEVEAYLRRTYNDGILDPAVAGTVSVTLYIDQQGTVEWAEVSQSSGRTDLDEVALALFNEVADFRAARDRGDSVSRSVTFSLNFPW